MFGFGSIKILVFCAFTSLLAVFATNGHVFASSVVKLGTSADAPVQILAFGDSLTAGYGLPPGEGFTDQLEVWLNAHSDVAVHVVNGGVSGDTSTGGLSRLDWGLSPFKNGKPSLVIVEFGANDALRGVSPKIVRTNIDAMMKILADRKIPALITGMLATPIWGREYVEDFDTIFPDMARKYDVLLYPFFLEGVALNPALNQSDGIHPTKEGVAIIVEKMGPIVLKALGQ